MYTEYQIGRWFLVVFRPLCSVFGMVGNIMCVIVVTSTSLRHSPTAVYMVTLAMLDFVISVYGGLDLLLKDFALGEETFFRRSRHCRAFFFGILFTVHFDTLTLVSMTAQRYVAVRFPLQAARMGAGKRGAVVNLVVAAVIAFLANVVHLLTYDIHSPDGRYRSRCDVGIGLGRFIQMRAYPWVDFALYFFIPTVSISIFNVLICRACEKRSVFRWTRVMRMANLQWKRHFRLR